MLTAYEKTYIFVVIEGIEHIIRQAGEQVYEEPRLEIILPYNLWITDNFSAGTHEGRVKIQHYIDEKHHVHNGVYHKEGHVFARFVLEGHVVGHHDGCVEGQAEDNPVPDGFKRAVVE